MKDIRSTDRDGKPMNALLVYPRFPVTYWSIQRSAGARGLVR